MEKDEEFSKILKNLNLEYVKLFCIKTLWQSKHHLL